ncbi:MAG: histone deacetylase [Vicinamibacterales bacterium]
MIIFSSDRFADHLTPPGHPERPERAEVLHRVAERWAARGAELVAPPPVADVDLLRVHTPAYVAAIRATAGRAVRLDPDTSTSPDSCEVASLAAGAAVAAVDRVLARPADGPALACVRPPGHHAEADRAMGFCLFNSIAVAAAHARAAGVERVAIVDFDVHHGNGTQAAFYDDPTVLFVSSHQHPYYPGTGAASEIGVGPGRGFTVNLPLEAGAGDADVDEAYRRVALPVLDAFAPGLVLVSAGFDAHVDDPLAALRMTPSGFANLTRLLLGLADRHAGGRIVFATEGGYDLDGLETSLHATMEACAAGVTIAEPPLVGDRRRGQAAAAAARAALGDHWRM